MSFWSKEGKPLIRKSNFKYPQTKTVNLDPSTSQPKEKPIQEEHDISELLAELQTALNDKSRLQSDLDELRTEVVELRLKNDGLQKLLNDNKCQFERDFNQLHEEIRTNETNLLSSSKKCLGEQKKFHTEVKKLRHENEALKLSVAKAEAGNVEKQMNLEKELKLSEINYNTLKSFADVSAQKLVKYKFKVKYAIAIISDLNNILIQSMEKPACYNVSTQTKEIISSVNLQPSESNCSQSASVRPIKSTSVTEKILLSDIFFKPKSFCDKEELLLFNNSD